MSLDRIERANAARREWLASEMVDPVGKRELEAMSEAESLAAFGQPMTFGTAGLRAIMGPGISRMNPVTVACVTAGLAAVIAAEGKAACAAGVVIAYDSRHHSDEFARRAAEVLAACGIRAYLFGSLCPTPVLSFAVRYLGCTAGINITASHNAKEYNGYKVYWSDGAQIAPELAEKIAAASAALHPLTDVPPAEAADRRLITEVPGAVGEAYLEAVQAQAVNPAVLRQAENLKVVYTPLYGTGAVMVPEILRRCGMRHLIPVEEQMTPDGDFPTTPYPNPENADVFALGVTLAREQNSDLLIATDPDADRVGTMVRDRDGQFRTVSGNQMGALLLEYIITAYRETGGLPPHPFVVKSFVTTALADRICLANGVALEEVLTGFKYIGEAIKAHEIAGEGTFLFGFEESYGYLKGTYARDKDAVVSSMLICEMAAYYSLRGMTLLDALEALYSKYGYYRESSFSARITGADAGAQMRLVMERLRQDAPESIAGDPVAEVRDYLSGTVTDCRTGAVRDTGLPRVDALYFVTARDMRVIIRPSGTEPKVKIYMMAGGTREKVEAAIADCTRFWQSRLLGAEPKAGKS